MMLSKAYKYREVVDYMRVKGDEKQKESIPEYSRSQWIFLKQVNDLLEPTIEWIKVRTVSSYIYIFFSVLPFANNAIDTGG